MEFKFKQFTIKQARSAMKVNTDGVLLGAWMTLPQPQGDLPPLRIDLQQTQVVDLPYSPVVHLLDIGTGTGVIALMAAQRVSQMQNNGITTFIDALEIDLESYKDAVENFANSPWGSGTGGVILKAEHSSLQQYAQLASSISSKFSSASPTSLASPTYSVRSKYDLIFSNPPYFTDSLKAPNKARSTARHTDTLSQSEIIKYALMLLKEGGRLAIILPAEEGEQFMQKINFLLESAHKKIIRRQLERSDCQSVEQIDQLAGLAHQSNEPALQEEGVLAPVRLCKVCTTARKPPKRYLMEFELVAKAAALPIFVNEQLVITKDGCYTATYQELVNSFYINL